MTQTAANDNAIPRQHALPAGVAPRGLSRAAAAAWIDVSPTLFDILVRDGRMPQPRLLNARTVWDRYEVDEAFSMLPHRGASNPWDE